MFAYILVRRLQGWEFADNALHAAPLAADPASSREDEHDGREQQQIAAKGSENKGEEMTHAEST